MFLSIKFKNCLIDTSNFSDLDLKNALFLECVIRDTHFHAFEISCSWQDA
ncbi:MULTISPECIES: hypothetical protein [Candidatus Rhabdochlamydia]